MNKSFDKILMPLKRRMNEMADACFKTPGANPYAYKTLKNTLELPEQSTCQPYNALSQ